MHIVYWRITFTDTDHTEKFTLHLTHPNLAYCWNCWSAVIVVESLCVNTQVIVNTPDSHYQLVRRELRTWTVFRLTCFLQCALLPTPWAGKRSWSLFHFGTFTHGFSLRSIFPHRQNLFCFLSICAFRGCGFGRRLQGGWDVRFQCYQAKVSIFRDLLLHL